MEEPVQLLPEDANVLGPSLRICAWDFSRHGRLREWFKSSTEADASWIRQLVQCAASHKAALAKIEMKFSPYEYKGTTEEQGYIPGIGWRI